MKESKTIGVIGGMGPLATCDFYQKIIYSTKAKTDNEHLHLLIDSNIKVPDRTKAILYNGESPVPALIESAKRLEAAGADFLVMTCNTSHYFYDEIDKQINIPFLNMVDITCRSVKKKGIGKVALLATEGTVASNIYQNMFDNYEIHLMIPDRNEQKIITDVIYKGIKCIDEKYDMDSFQRLIVKLTNDGAEAIILGCTELPLAIKRLKISGNFIDSTQELACAAILEAGGVVMNHI